MKDCIEKDFGATVYRRADGSFVTGRVRLHDWEAEAAGYPRVPVRCRLCGATGWQMSHYLPGLDGPVSER